MPTSPVSIPQFTVYGKMIEDKNGDGRPDHVDARAIRVVEQKVKEHGEGPVGSDLRSTILLGLGVDYLRGVGEKLARKLDAATFGNVSTIDNFQDMQRPSFTADGRLITNFPLPSDTPRARLYFPQFSKSEQAVLKARWDAVNAVSNQAPHLPTGFNRVDQITSENERRDPQITISGQTKSHYWLPQASTISVDADNHVATIALSAHRIFTFSGGAGFAPLPEGPREFKTKVDLDLPIVRPGNWTVNLVDASNPNGPALSSVSFLYDPISSPPPRDPRIS